MTKGEIVGNIVIDVNSRYDDLLLMMNYHQMRLSLMSTSISISKKCHIVCKILIAQAQEEE
jgi:hypothetical protein